jgi:hypothetical protein
MRSVQLRVPAQAGVAARARPPPDGPGPTSPLAIKGEAMRSKFAIAALVAVVVAATGTGLASATAGSDDTGRTFTVFSKTVQFAAIDLGDKGPSLGDKVVFSDDLLTRKGGDNVGFDGGECTVVRRDEAAKTDTVQCVVTFSFAGGQIATQALLTLTNGNFTGTQTGPVTGGSGDFRGADGEVSVMFFSNEEANITFNLDD